MSDWAEHTHADGKKYYHNRRTKQSVWDKPEELRLFEQQQHYQQQQQHAAQASATSSSSSTVLPPHWKEYLHAETGRKYYHNTITNETSWELPSTNAAPSSSSSAPSSAAAAPAATKETSSSSSSSSVSTSSPTLTSSQSQLQSQSTSSQTQSTSSPTSLSTSNNNSNNNNESSKPSGDPIKMFKDMLQQADVASNWSFEKAHKLVANDERYHLLKTMSERKQAFQEYLGDRKVFEYEEKRRKEKRCRDELVRMLRESPEVSPSMTWLRAQLYFDGDSKWEAVDSEREREDLFRTYVMDIQKREKDDRDNLRRDTMRNLRAKLETNDLINLKTLWSKFKEHYENDPLYQQMDKYDVLCVFESYIRDLEKKEEDTQRKERERLRREARKHRDLFRDFMLEQYMAGELQPTTHWQQFYKRFGTHPTFENLASQTTGSSPLELFMDFREEMTIRFERDFDRLRDMIKDLNFQFIPKQTTLEELKQALSKHERFSILSQSSIPPFLEYLEDREKRRAKDVEKRKKDAIGNFKVLLQETRSIGKHSTWSEVRPTLTSRPEFEELEDESERERIFKEFIEFLSNEESDEEGIIKSDDESKSRREFSKLAKRSSLSAENIDDQRSKKKRRE
ncbi:hypothetical protein SAMD00019534_058950 [Acytostelium subglobosum LB1]|uniref:hypothetical protein n=1 Tax=Acytostelium subglobosum LB1 TaxID=1410327 RepID=UPI000644B824|nr:hypothetical protein SAMD00019534_058950 [Acytostelium subglobosum LB1]GAM22720.1 hypothetical protein SAMD00019534_058950 [Acytostelium subglobosum LB1]|eukprot:XP_012753947.1 hypothetical protein SAMD00019534_058950 [Acytostelium subglobosum LB1]